MSDTPTTKEAAMIDGTTITESPDWDPDDEYRDDPHYRDGYAEALNAGRGLNGLALDDLFWREVDERRDLINTVGLDEAENAYRLGLVSGYAALWNARKFGEGSNRDQ